jgi:hypothetical protein
MPGGSRSPHFVVARARQRSGGRGHGAHDHAEVFAPVALGALDQERPELIALDSASGPDQSVISSFETAVLPAPIGPERMVTPASLCPRLDDARTSPCRSVLGRSISFRCTVEAKSRATSRDRCVIALARRSQEHASVAVSLDALSYILGGGAEKRSRQPVSKSELKWSEKQEDADFDAAFKYLSLLCSDRKAHALVKSLRGSKILEHAAKDMLRAAQLPLLPSDESHVSEDLKRIQKGKALAPVLLVRGDLASGFPLIVADGYHRICAVCYFDESAQVRCRIADLSA